MNGNLKDMLPLLQTLGISPDRLGPERLEQLMKMTDQITDPSQLTEETTRKLMDIIGITTKKNVEPKKSSVKIGRNEPCICESGLKYKKCCGKQ
jgi:uncharacterized protein YecA (UPF0149 family)